MTRAELSPAGVPAGTLPTGGAPPGVLLSGTAKRVAIEAMNLVPAKYATKPMVSAPQKSLTDTLIGNCVSERREATMVTADPRSPAENAFRRRTAAILI